MHVSILRRPHPNSPIAFTFPTTIPFQFFRTFFAAPQ